MKSCYVWFLPLVLLASACEQEIDIDAGQTDPRVVVMSCVEPDTTVGLRLTYSRYFLSQGAFRTVDDASVSLSVNGQPFGGSVSSPSAGNYSVAYVPQVGDRLDLHVQVPGGGVVSASTVVPRPADVSDLRASEKTTGQGARRYSVRFSLHDPADEDNYYFIRVVELEYGSLHYRYFSCNDYLLTDGLSLVDAIDGMDEESDGVYSLLAFPDDNIAGSSHEVDLTVNPYGYSDPQLFLEVTSLSRDRYLYDLTALQYADDPFETLFAEPVPIHCNISGGIGIFAARNRQLLPIPILP